MPDKVTTLPSKETPAKPSQLPAEPVEKACVVCGLGSHRTDWLQVSGEQVACDFHTKEEIAAALKGQVKAPPVVGGGPVVPEKPEAPPLPGHDLPGGDKPDDKPPEEAQPKGGLGKSHR